jgi:hypothetical protein
MGLRAHNHHPEPGRAPTVTATRRSAGTASRWAVAAAALALLIVVPSTGAASAAGAGRTAAPAHVSARSQYVEFRSPSKNIYCHISSAAHYNEARCDIHHHTFQAPPKPASCQFDWGQSVMVHHRARWACVSDPATGSLHVPALGYGQSKTLAHIRCTSRATGMVCRNLSTGHGFKLSRAAVSLF